MVGLATHHNFVLLSKFGKRVKADTRSEDQVSQNNWLAKNGDDLFCHKRPECKGGEKPVLPQKPNKRAREQVMIKFRR